MRFFIKKPGAKPVNQYIKIDLHIYIIEEDREESNIVKKYWGEVMWAEFLANSRIDGHPCFVIDTTNIERDDKINKILDE